jgi:hypothetical protein
MKFERMNIQRLLFGLLPMVALVAVGSSLQAQTNTPPPLTEVRFMSWEVGQEGLFITLNDREYSPITAPAYELGVAISVRTATPLRVYERIENADGISYAVVGETLLPEACRTAQVYLIRRPDREGRRDYRLIALSNDAEAFSVGKIRIFNFSPWPAAIRINGQGSNLASLEWRIVDAVPDHKNRVPLQAALQLPEGGWTPVVRDMVTLRKNYRGSVTLLHTRRSFDETAPEAIRSQARMFIQTTSEYLNPKPE